MHRSVDQFTVEQVYKLPFEGWLKLISDLRLAAQRASFLILHLSENSLREKQLEEPFATALDREPVRRSSYPPRNYTVETTFSLSILQTPTSAFRHHPTDDWSTTNCTLSTSWHLPPSLLVFPPVEVNGVLYVDGGLRQNAPLHPLIQGKCARFWFWEPR